MKLSKIGDIVLRYLILVLVAFPNLWIFYFILKLFFDVSLMSNFIVINKILTVEIISACIAGAAYYFLLVLNLSTPKIDFKHRASIIIFSFTTLLILNIFRILILILIARGGTSFFGLTHEIFWYGLSTVFVIVIWFSSVRIFRVKEIPFYSDLKYLYKKSHLND